MIRSSIMRRCSCSPICPICTWRRGRGLPSLSASAGSASSIGSASANTFIAPKLLEAIMRDLKAFRARPHRGDRRSGQSVARRTNTDARAGLARDARHAARRHRRSRQPRRLCRAASSSRRPPIGATTCAATTARDRFPFVRRRGDVALIALSTGVPTGPFMATGRLGERQLARHWPKRSTQTRGSFRIVLIHHPPLSPPNAICGA